MWTEKEKKPILPYIFLAFLIAWCSEALLFLGERLGILVGSAGVVIATIVIGFGAGLAPLYAIYILLKKHGEIRGIKDFCRRIFKTDNLLKTIIITVLFCLSQLIPNIICNDYLGDPWYLFILYIPMMIVGGGLEEVGWRGFLQPALEEKFPFLFATLISGVLWAVWHIPLWFIQNASQSSFNFISFLCYCIMGAFVLAALYKVTKSVAACIFFHAWVNVLGGMFTSDILENPIDVKLIIIYLVMIVASIIVFLVADKKSRKTVTSYGSGCF